MPRRPARRPPSCFASPRSTPWSSPPSGAPTPRSRCAAASVLLVGALAAPHPREVLIDEAGGDVHVDEETLEARMLVKEDDSGFLEDPAILLGDRPQRGD